MGFIYYKECLGGLVEAHVTDMLTHTVPSKYLSMAASSSFAPWSLAQIKLEALQNALPDELTCLLSAQADKLKPDLDATVIIHDMADVTGSQLDGQQAPISGLCSSAGVLAAEPVPSQVQFD